MLGMGTQTDIFTTGFGDLQQVGEVQHTGGKP